MANTLQLLTQLTDSTNGLSFQYDQSVTTTGDDIHNVVFEVGTSEEEFTISTEIGNAGWCVIVNKDATNFVDIGFATTDYKLRLNAGESLQTRLAPTVASLFLKADTAACNILIAVYED